MESNEPVGRIRKIFNSRMTVEEKYLNKSSYVVYESMKIRIQKQPFSDVFQN